MGKRTKAKQEEIIEKEHVYFETLKQNPTKKKISKRKVNGLEIITRMPSTVVSHLNLSQMKDQLVKYRPKSYNEDAQVIELIRKFVCKYNVPKFMFKACTMTRNIENDFIDWFYCMATGGSFHKTYGHRVFTKKGSHIFMTSRNDLSIRENIWRAKILSFGGDQSHVNAIIQSFNLVIMDICDPFWDEAVKFFIKNPAPKKELQELFDFIIRKHLEDNHFNFKGRTLQSLIKLSNDWHIEMMKLKDEFGSVWNGLPIEDWIHEEKIRENGNMVVLGHWMVEQIKSSKRLIKEGQALKHCVGGYVDRCVNGNSFIFTLGFDTQYGVFQKLLTIEVSPNYTITQVRGKRNRYPTEKEKSIVKMWGRKNNLRYNAIG